MPKGVLKIKIKPIPPNQTGKKFPNRKKPAPLSKEHRKHISEALKGKMPKFIPNNRNREFSEEWKENLSKAHLGHKHSEETKRKMSEVKKGKMPKNIEMIRGWNKGKKMSKEYREKLSKARIGQFAGEKHPNWKGGISNNPYPREFNSLLKFKIRQKDNFTCCLCGRTEREELEELNRVLCINHIDFDKNNNKEENLNTLCLRCNLMINWDREKWTNYFLNYV